MKVGRIGIPIRKEDIPFSDMYITQKYLGILKLPTLVNNPLREDKHPSLSIFINRLNNIGLKDFSTGEYFSLYSFLEKLWNCNRREVYKRILNDTPTNTLKKIKLTKPKLSKLTNLKVKIRDFKKEDYEYWDSYGISKEFLKFFNVHPISHIILEYENHNIISKASELAYVYIENKDNNITIKIYQPFASRENKFKNNHNNSVWDLWNNLPKKGDKLIITSSRKDAMCLWSNLGIPSICMQSESVKPNPKVIQELKDRFKEVYVLYDNDYSNPDNPGQSYANLLCKDYHLHNIFIPSEYQSKDPSDLYKKVGKEEFIKIISNLLTSKN